MRTYNIGFILEQALGHVTHAMNLQKNVPNHPEVRAHWGLIPFETTGIVSHIPVYNSNWTLRAGLRARRAVAQIARRTSLDALFFHTQVPAIFSTTWVRKIPSIVSLDATPIQFDQLGAFYKHKMGPPWMERLKWRLNRDCYAGARHIVTWSEWAKRGVIEGYEVPAERITVIPPGVNIGDWTRPTPRAASDGPVKILFVGGDLERKGGLLLIEAFRALRPLGIELHLVTKDKVEPEPGLYVYNNMRPNSQPLKDLYHSCDIFALPTYGDTLALVLSEAGAAGMATVATRVGGLPEIVRDGETGLTVPTGDTAALIQTLRELVTNPGLRMRLGESAIAHVSREYDAEKNASRLLSLLKDEADRARKRNHLGHD